MPDRDYYSLDQRVRAVEMSQSSMVEQNKNLTKATEDNTSAIKDLTKKLDTIANNLAFNKGVVWTSLKVASSGTVIIAGLFALTTWGLGFIHFGPK